MTVSFNHVPARVDLRQDARDAPPFTLELSLELKLTRAELALLAVYLKMEALDCTALRLLGLGQGESIKASPQRLAVDTELDGKGS